MTHVSFQVAAYKGHKNALLVSALILIDCVNLNCTKVSCVRHSRVYLLTNDTLLISQRCYHTQSVRGQAKLWGHMYQFGLLHDIAYRCKGYFGKSIADSMPYWHDGIRNIPWPKLQPLWPPIQPQTCYTHDLRQLTPPHYYTDQYWWTALVCLDRPPLSASCGPAVSHRLGSHEGWGLGGWRGEGGSVSPVPPPLYHTWGSCCRSACWTNSLFLYENRQTNNNKLQSIPFSRPGLEANSVLKQYSINTLLGFTLHSSELKLMHLFILYWRSRDTRAEGWCSLRYRNKLTSRPPSLCAPKQLPSTLINTKKQRILLKIRAKKHQGTSTSIQHICSAYVFPIVMRQVDTGTYLACWLCTSGGSW